MPLIIFTYVHEPLLYFKYTEQQFNHPDDLKLKFPEQNLDHQGSCFTHVLLDPNTQL